MKKISLKDVKNGLKRDEMRAISGGSGSDYGCPPCDPRKWIRYGGGCTVSGYC